MTRYAEIHPALIALVLVFVAWAGTAAVVNVVEHRRRRRGQLPFKPRMRS